VAELQAFFHMGGYAFYVWPSFLISLAVLAGNVMYSKVQFKRVLRETAIRADALSKKNAKKNSRNNSGQKGSTEKVN